MQKENNRLPDGADQPELTFTWQGTLADAGTESDYRQKNWPMLARQQGLICSMASLLFLLAGAGPVLEMGLTPMVAFITGFRAVVSAAGVGVFLYTKKQGRQALYPGLLIFFIMAIGSYEAVEAVLTYAPGLDMLFVT